MCGLTKRRLVFGNVIMQPYVVQTWLGEDAYRNVTEPLVKVSVFLAAFSGLYFTVYAVTDETYRQQFFTSVTREYSEPLGAMAAALCPTGTSVSGQRCASPTTLSSLEVNRDGRATIKGPVGVGATAAENFLMEAAEGWPKDQVAWGRLAGDSELLDLLSIHRLDIDLTRKTAPIARQQGSNMLAQIVETLVDGHRFPGLAAGPEPIRFALLMGHDTNISHIESMLRLAWHIPGFQANDASPGGALAFELYSEVGTNQRFVRLAYYAQTLQQMRQAATLSLNDPPGMQAVDLPGCAAWAYQRSCPLAKFVEIARAAIDPGCVTIKP